MTTIEKALNIYFKNRPAFLGLIRCKEIELMARNLEILKQDKKLKILDFGCGDGFYLHVLSEFVDLSTHEITGVDISSEVFADAESYDLYSKLDVYDGSILPYKDGAFDLVISNCVLEHVTDLAGNLAEISRVMKQGGEFQTTVMSANWDNYLFGSILLGDRYMHWMRKKQVHKNLLSATSWKDRFTKAGLTAQIETGYINKKMGRLLDLMHYYSAPSLINKKFFKKWVLFPKLVDLTGFYKRFAQKYNREVEARESAAIYFKLHKR